MEQRIDRAMEMRQRQLRYRNRLHGSPYQEKISELENEIRNLQQQQMINRKMEQGKRKKIFGLF
jgi:hypothetical protein